MRLFTGLFVSNAILLGFTRVIGICVAVYLAVAALQYHDVQVRLQQFELWKRHINILDAHTDSTASALCEVQILE